MTRKSKEVVEETTIGTETKITFSQPILRDGRPAIDIYDLHHGWMRLSFNLGRGLEEVDLFRMPEGKWFAVRVEER